ncbi:MAG TPA: type VI secretion system tip protein TssI/VgrG [Polyangiaceae bacterium]
MPRTFQTAFQLGGVQAFHVLNLREVHELSQPAYVEVDVLLPTYLDTEDCIGQTAELAFGWDDEPGRQFVAVVESVTVVGSSSVGDGGRTYQYSFVLVSPLSLLAGNHGCLIQQDVDVKAAVSAVLTAGASMLKVDWRLTGSYPQRAYCVQYQETDLAYVSRLLESEGIYYFFEAADDGTLTLVIGDDSTAVSPIDGDPTLHRRNAVSGKSTDSILKMGETSAVASGKFTLRDFNFEQPKVDMTSTAQASVHPDFEVYDYPGGYLTPADGKRIAQLRLDAEQVEVQTLSIETDCTRVSVGRKLTVADTVSADGDWLVTRVVHEHEWSTAGEDRYTCRADLIPSKTKFRPARVTPRPVIEGPQTASVVCPTGSQPEEILTDEHGRCKVKFPWDLGPAMDDKATAWMRVSQLQTSGSMMLPRIDWEVIVEFLEGDPDRPIVTGRLYNGLLMPPYALPDGKTRTSIKTTSTPGGGGTNEIRMEDKSGSEEIMMHSQKDTNVAVANNKTKNVGNNETLNVGADSTTTIGANQTVKITKGSKNDIKADQTVVVGGTRSLEVNAVAAWNVTGNSTTTVGAAQHEQIGNPLEALIALAVAKAAEIAAAKAKDAVAAVQGAVQGKIDQALGPVNDLVGKAGALGSGLQALGNGDLSALGGVVGGATGLPGVGAMGAAMAGPPGGGGGGGAGGDPGGGSVVPGGVTSALAAPSAANVAMGNMLNSALGNAIQSAASKATAGLDAAAGVDADGGGSSSLANSGGPAGAVAGVDQTDRTKGPGHSTYKCAAKHSETVGSIKVVAALNGINTNIAGNMKQQAGAAIVQMSYADYAEAVTGNKTEKELGLVILAKGESEHSKGAKTAMIGGLVLDKVGGNQSIEASGNLTIVGALQKIEASTSITLKCGESEVAITGDGITIKAAGLISFTGATMQIPKPAMEG